MTSLGIRVHRMAGRLTPAQLAEMLAVKQTAMSSPRLSLILASHWPSYRPLVRSGLVYWYAAPEPFGRKWRHPVLTRLGEIVLLARVEDELRRAGALPPEEDRGE